MVKPLWHQSKRRQVCLFKDKVEYLGHEISSEGLHTAPKKVEAIKAAPNF